MSRESLVFVLGFLVFLVQFLGIPQDWKEIFFLGAGVALMVLGFILRRVAFLRSIENESGERASDAFAESVQQKEPIFSVISDADKDETP